MSSAPHFKAMTTELENILSFDNSFVTKLPKDPQAGPAIRQVDAAWSAVEPTHVAAPRVIAVSEEMMAALGLPVGIAQSPAFASVFSGNAQLPGMQPHATNYGGHQFGHWAGQLGDGRAITLGEAVAPAGQHWELQLKGAGPTPYSRHADGRAVLRSSVREFLCSEAMHHLGVPTTRALTLIATGEPVLRDMFYDGRVREEPGAIVCRMSPSFLRFGHFQLPASRGDIALTRELVDFCIQRDFPHLVPAGGDAHAEWFKEICVRTARMIAAWMRVGFVHGVMNTDNMSVLGLTIDYGPYGFLDAYDPDFTPNTTDAQGRRYRFGWQPRIAYWNLQQLAASIAPLFSGTAELQRGLDAYVSEYAAGERENAARKLGLSRCTDEDLQLMRDLHAWMHATEVDMTLFFNALKVADPEALTPSDFDPVFYDAAKQNNGAETFRSWLSRYQSRLREDAWDPALRLSTLQSANPEFILRNWMTQRAIERAEAGDEQGIHDLLRVLREPYREHPGFTGVAGKRPEWARSAPGCSMLSCSS